MGKARIREPYCFYCEHLTRYPFCKAFPDGIPRDIRLGIVLHDKPYKSDGGIQFKPVERRGKKAADEPAPAVRGKPLPKDEATEGWEVTEEDMEAAQEWVDRAMKEAGFRE